MKEPINADVSLLDREAVCRIFNSNESDAEKYRLLQAEELIRQGKLIKKELGEEGELTLEDMERFALEDRFKQPQDLEPKSPPITSVRLKEEEPAPKTICVVKREEPEPAPKTICVVKREDS